MARPASIARPRSTARVATAVFCAVVGGCLPQGQAPEPPQHYDDGWQTTPLPSAAPSAGDSRRHVIPPELRKPWARRDELDRLTAVGRRSRSDHLGGRYERTIRRNQLADGYERLGGPPKMPSGAIIVQLHHEPGSDQLVTAYVMEKGPPGRAPERGDWEFLVLDAQWRVEAREGLRHCVSCHQAGINDWLFGQPLATEP